MTNLEKLQTGPLENPALPALCDKSSEELRYEYYQAHNIGKGDQLQPATAPLKEETIFQEMEDMNFEEKRLEHNELLKNCSIEDIRCFEEVRGEFCEAIKNGSVDQYKQKLQMALKQSGNRIRALVNVLTHINKGNYSFTTGIFPTNTSQSTNVFGQTNQQTGFNQTHTSSQLIFAAAIQDLFPSPPQQSIFGRSSTNVFASAASTPNQYIFRGTAFSFSVPQTNSPFGTETISSPLSISQTNLPFQTNKDNSPFGENFSSTLPSLPAQMTNSPFGSPFGEQTTSSPLRISQTSLHFQTNKDNTPFGENSNSTSPYLFGQMRNSTFAGQQNQSASIISKFPLMKQKESPKEKKKRKRHNF